MEARLTSLAGGKTYKLTTLFPVAVGQDLDVVVKYQAADVSHTAETFKDNMAVIQALVAKYPELRDAFGESSLALWSRPARTTAPCCR